MSNHANFVQNRRQTQELQTLNNLMTQHKNSQDNTGTSVDSLTTLQTKTFTNGVAQTESISSATPKQFSMMGGVNHTGSSFNIISPARVDTNGNQYNHIVNTVNTDLATANPSRKVFTNGQSTQEAISSATPKQQMVMSGVDHGDSSFANINSVKVDAHLV